MKIVNILFLVYTAQLSLAQAIDLGERQKYFQQQPLYASLFAAKKKKPEFQSAADKANENLKKCLGTFWDLNDTIIFVPAAQMKGLKKENPNAVFLETLLINGQVPVYTVSIPGKKELLKDISPRPWSGDTLLLELAGEIRQLRLNVLTGAVINNKELGKKIILIDKAPSANEYHNKFTERIKNVYPNAYLEVDRQTLVRAIFTRDRRYIYVNGLSLYNAEDGSLIPF